MHHLCGEYYCRRCERKFTEAHECYLRSYTDESDELKSKHDVQMYIVYDIETTQNTLLQCDKGYQPPKRCDNCCNKSFRCSSCSRCINCHSLDCGSHMHIPNLIVTEKWCMECAEIPFSECEYCSTCGDRCSECKIKSSPNSSVHSYLFPFCSNGECGRKRRIFYGHNAIQEFCAWLVNLQHTHATVCAHNASRFDSYFTLKQLMIMGTKISDVIVKGGQILYFRIPAPHNIRFIDSIKILLSRLSKLPEMFGMNNESEIDANIRKGFFPHLFNTTDKIDNNYIGKIPDRKYYAPEHMNPESRSEFNTWYEQMQNKPNYVFNLKQELIKYCINDVIILKLAIIEFDKIIYS